MSISFDRVADIYDESRGGTARAQWIAAELSPYLPAGPVVELGVGTGIVAKALVDRGFPVLGLDLSAAMLQRARLRLGARVVQGDAELLPFADGSMRSMVSVWLLHLLSSPGAVLAEVARVLEPSGTYVVVCTGEVDEPLDCDRPVRALRERLQAGFGRADSAAALVEAAPPQLHAEQLVSIHAAPYEVTPRQMAQNLRDRVNSWAFGLSDEVIEPVVAQLLALPDPDRPRTGRGRLPLLRFTRLPR